MASYLDSLSQGMQNSYSQLYRKPRYTQIGNTQVGSPQRISLDRLYGGSPTYSEMPTLGAPVQAPSPYSSEGLSITGYSPTAYLKEAGWAQDEEGVWMPEWGGQGQIYEDQSGARFVRRGDEWIELDENKKNYELWDYASNPAFKRRHITLQRDLLSIQRSYDSLQKRINEVTNAINNAQNYVEREPLEEELARLKNGMQEMRNEEARLQAEQGKLDQELRSELFESEADIGSWKDQAEELFSGLESGEFDLENLPEGNMMADWIRNVIGNSEMTGGILGDFFDEAGNLAPELQSMYDYIYDHPDTQKQFQEFNRNLAANAIAQGKSVNSGIFAEHYAGQMTEYAIGVGQQVADAMMNEIQDQYTYIASSMEKLLREMVSDEDANQFAERMQLAYDAANQEYEQFIEQMQMQAEELSAARFGDIFTGVLSGILNVAFSFL